MRTALLVALVPLACLAGCAADDAGDATSESFVGSGGSVVGGKDGIRSLPGRMTHDTVALADGGAVTPLEPRYDTVAGENVGYVFHALELTPATGEAPVHLVSPAPFARAVAGPDGSALVLGFVAGGRALYRMTSSSPPELLGEGPIGGVTTATDGSIVWIESGASPKLHRRRGEDETVVPLAKDPYERTFASCRSFLLADASRVYDVCISGFVLEPRDEVQRIRTFATDGSLESEVLLSKEPFGGILTGFDGGGRLLVMDTGYTGDGDANVGIHGFRYDPATQKADTVAIPVFPHTERWRPWAIVPMADGGFVMAGNANERFAMVKLGADGRLDTSFDRDGAMSAKSPDAWGTLVSGKVSADGAKIALLGRGQDRTYALEVWLH